MKITILGCHSATPRVLANPTSQALEIKNHLFLIDCGEGTQVQLRKQQLKFSRIKHIFISHLHGDHFFGLPGLISTFQLLGREAELHIYGPQGIQEAITLFLKVSQTWNGYPLIFHELTAKEPQLLWEDDSVSVSTLPLRHRIYTNGFLFREKPADRKLNMLQIANYPIDRSYYPLLKSGKDITLEDGLTLPNALLTLDPPPPRSYAFCSDTAYYPPLAALIKDVTVLYHEATFLEVHQELAEKTGHSTAKQAASIARSAGVKTLVLGHYSTRYNTINHFKEEAQTIFQPVELAQDGAVFEF
jgi:ribonuclease Z